MRKLWLLALLINAQFTYAQSELPQDYFANPLDVPLILSGTFGELRSNHFHSGLDIKTKQQTGLKVLAAAEGYVSRIKISHFGYGKAIYVKHPNGYTTVYGHLNGFSSAIDKYVKQRQYAKETYEIELFPKAGELPVKKQEIIAFSGNTGGSGGPHLHFEIRDGNARPMNPLDFGYEIKDTKFPTVKSVYAYPQTNNSHLDESGLTQKIRLIPIANNEYVAETVHAYGKIGFGIETIDQLDYAANRNGVYKIESFLNGNKIFSVNFNKFSFSESRYINRFLDYAIYKNKRKKIQKLFLQPNNPLSILKDAEREGFVNIEDSLNYNYTIKVSDFAENTTTVKIPISAKALPDTAITRPENFVSDYHIKPNEASAFDIGKFDVYIPKNAVYEDVYINIIPEGESIIVGKKDIALHYNMTIGFDVSKYAAKDKDKLYIARVTDWGKAYYVDTYKKRNRFTTKTRTFGKYTLLSDWEGPEITPMNFKNKKWMSNYRYLKFKIEDKESGISSYRATVNGEFILMEYDYKTGMLIHDFNDDVIKETKNNLKLIVVDNVGNSSTFEGTFFRKN